MLFRHLAHFSDGKSGVWPPGGKDKRSIVKGSCRSVVKDSGTIGGPHHEATCKAAGFFGAEMCGYCMVCS